MSVYELRAIIISIAAVAVALAGIVVSYNANRRSHVTQNKLLELESARERDRVADRGRAEIRARFVPVGRGRRLEFYNEGQGTARHVQVFSGGRPMSEDQRLVDPSSGFETIGAGGSAFVIATMALQADALFRLRIAWEDDSGLTQPRSWESDLNG